MDIDAGDTARGLSDDEVLRVYAASKAQVLFLFWLFFLYFRALCCLFPRISQCLHVRETHAKKGVPLELLRFWQKHGVSPALVLCDTPWRYFRVVSDGKCELV